VSGSGPDGWPQRQHRPGVSPDASPDGMAPHSGQSWSSQHTGSPPVVVSGAVPGSVTAADGTRSAAPPEGAGIGRRRQRPIAANAAGMLTKSRRYRTSPPAAVSTTRFGRTNGPVVALVPWTSCCTTTVPGSFVVYAETVS
jgi:hypothetical protein